MQVSWCLGLLHHQDLLDDATQVSRDWLRTQGQVQQRRARGSSQGEPTTPAHSPQGEADSGLPQAHGDRPRLHREVTKLL